MESIINIEKLKTSSMTLENIPQVCCCKRFVIQGESQNFCHCVYATNYKFVTIENTAFSSR